MNIGAILGGAAKGELLSLQVAIAPASEGQFDASSPIRMNNLTSLGDGRIKTRRGFAAGVSILDGILCIGVLYQDIDQRGYIAGAPAQDKEPQAIGFYLRFQLGATTRFILKE